jgi:hypothetical protein
MRAQKIVFLFAICLSFFGCAGGGGFCPVNIPSCCYDTLFGCGTFDLPSGCSCSDYGYMSRVDSNKFLSKNHQKKSTPSNGLSGRWTGILKQKSSTCSSFLKQINGVIQINDSTKRISVKVPGYGTLKGTKRPKGFKASGSYRPMLSFCNAKIGVNFSSIKNGVASTDTSINLSCLGMKSCTANYKGTLQRNS